MKILLMAAVDGVGSKDDVVEVKDGHARNYLIPRGLAVEATPGRLADVAKRERSKQLSRQREQEAARTMASRLDGKQVVVTRKASGEGRLFGAITAMDVAAQLSSTLGVDIDKRRIRIDTPIKSVGTHPVAIKLGSGETAVVNVVVQVEKGEADGQ